MRAGESSRRHLSGRRAWLVATALAMLLIPGNFLIAPAEGDAASYIAYTTTVLLDGDLDFSNEYAPGTLSYPSGRTLPTHAIGTSVFAAPFLFPFVYLDRAYESQILSDRSAYSSSFLSIGWLFAAATALFWGLSLQHKFIHAIGLPWRSRYSLWVLIGSGLGGYFVFQTPANSHIVTFWAASASAYLIWNVCVATSVTEQFFKSLVLGAVLALPSWSAQQIYISFSSGVSVRGHCLMRPLIAKHFAHIRELRS